MSNDPEKTVLNSGLSSLHTHSTFCDGKDDVETMCRTAFAKGLSAIGFSAHAPIEKAGFKTHWHLKENRLEKYVEEIRAARRRWQGKIAVYAGLEVDYIKGRRSAMDSDIQSLGLDYTISSVHYLIPPHGEPFAVDGSVEELETGINEGFGGDGEAMMHAYWDAILEMAALGGFDIVGHLDLLKKRNKAKPHDFPTGRWFNAESPAYMQRLKEVAAAFSGKGFAVEASTGGLNRKHIDEIYPSPQLLRLLRQYNVPVMVSADAHRASDLDGHYHYACQTLFGAGYDSHVVFNGRENGAAIWRSVSNCPKF